MLHQMRNQFFLASLLLVPSFSQADDLAEYKPSQLGQVLMQSVGSDSMATLVGKWTDKFKTFHPELTVNVVSQGSAAAPAALVDGSADLGPMARPMKTAELHNFRRKYGFEPTRVRTASAAAAIYVAQSNPISSISIEQLNAIFANNSTISKWSDLGVGGNLKNSPVFKIGSKGNPYVASYFRQRVLLQDDFAKDVQFTASNRALFEVVLGSPNAIAFGPVGEAPKGMKVIPVIGRKQKRSIAPTQAMIEAGKYPLGRFLNIYVAMGPSETLEPATKEFLSFILSKNGQAMVAAEGLMPLSASVANAELAKLQ